MKYGTFCSGIEAPTVAFDGLGFNLEFVSEIDKSANAVLSYHYPSVPNLGDMLTLDFGSIPEVDLVVAGTPCQPFSVAGNNRALDDPRSLLTTRFFEYLNTRKPTWFIWENVPNLLSEKTFSYFYELVNETSKAGYSIGWRIIDGANFGVPQRRKRLFTVGYLGDRSTIEQVLFRCPGNPVDHKTAERANQGKSAVAFDVRNLRLSDQLGTICAKSSGGYSLSYINPVVVDGIFRRLTPIEVERCMGFPDDYTNVVAESHRYRLLGNSMVTGVIRYLGQGIMNQI